MRSATVRLRWTTVLAVSAGLLATTIAVATVSPLVLTPGAHVTRQFAANLTGLAGALVFAGVGALVAARRTENPIGWLLCASAIFDVSNVFAAGPFATDLSLAILSAPWLAAWVARWMWVPPFALLPLVLVLFPDGHLVSPRWRPVAWLCVVGGTAVALGGAFAPGPLLPEVAIENPVGIPGAEWLTLGGYAVLGAGTLLAAAALVRRFGRSRGAERQQLKWVVSAGTLLVLVTFALGLLWSLPATRALDPEAPFPNALFGGAPYALSWAAFPVAIGIAILRHRLYDIDLLIKRTLVYGATSAALAITFFAGIVALQPLLRPLTEGSELAVAASTLISFALFQPVRRRVQAAVDRRFDRSRYDAARALDAFADCLRDEVDLDALRADLIGAVRQTMAPAHASLWLRGRVR